MKNDRISIGLVVLQVLLLALAMISLPQQTYSQAIVSYAYVLDDGSLQVRGQKIWLYGILIPATERTCRTYLIPIECGPRAVLALESKIGPFFVACEKKGEREDGSITALCRVKDEDLGAWMLQNGWAVALPDAPFEYQTLEKIARHHNRGIWGTVTGPP